MQYKFILIFSLVLLSLTSKAIDKKKWHKVWSEEFRGKTIDSRWWSAAPRSRADWSRYQSKDPRCTYQRGGVLYLRGIVNDNLESDSVPYLTGGLVSKDKFSFKHGKIEIRAKLQSAQGAWPALWLLGEKRGWPFNGEIDIMEHLNHDSMIYQTVHSDYTYNRGGGNNPPKGGMAALNPLVYNTYGVEIYPNKVCFFLNGKQTFVYPKADPSIEGQWPFDNDFYIVLSQQLEGVWVGKADPKQLPVEMLIDYIRVYEPRK